MRAFNDFYHRHSFVLDSIASLCISILLVVLNLTFSAGDAWPADCHSMYATLLSVGASVLGFELTALTLVISLLGNAQFAIFKTHEASRKQIIYVFKIALISMTFVTAISLFALFLHPTNPLHPAIWLALIFAAPFALVRLAACSWALLLFAQLFMSASDSENKGSETPAIRQKEEKAIKREVIQMMDPGDYDAASEE